MRLLPLLLLFTFGCTSTSPEGSRPEITVASDLANMPFAGVDENGIPEGRDVEMMRELARRLDMSLVWERMPFEELMPKVERGEVDAVCATLGVTPQRAARMGFTRPYYRTAIAVVVRTGVGEPLDLDELEGKRVAGSKGTTSERAVLGLTMGVVAVTENEKGQPLIERLLSADIDAAVMDGPAADAAVIANGRQLVRLTENLDQEHYGIAVDPRNLTLLEALDTALGELEESGWLDELNERYAIPASAK